ncbi:MAG: hypothetical protein AAGF92_21780 [Myxococcota bacterium]
MQPTKFQVKLYTSSGDVSLEALIPVFHEWIREKKIADELLIDVADYAHVPQGPGVVLIGHQSDYYLDMANDRPGLLYSRKRGFDGTFEDGLKDAFRRALGASQLLEAEPSLDLSFDTSEVLFRVQDRLSAPNSEATFEAYQGPLTEVANGFFGASASLERVEDAREPFSVRIQTGQSGSVADALARA